MTTPTQFFEALDQLPLVAIVRGIQPEEAVEVGRIFHKTGFRIMEVPLNSPRPFESIANLTQAFGDDLIIGAGTVRTIDDVKAVAKAGGKLIVMPHFDEPVVRAAVEMGLLTTPGVCTPSEAFGALNAGATGLKAFPGELVTPPVLKAMRAVLPKETRILSVGGINPDNLGEYWAAGANGFGLGSALYKPGMTLETIEENARRFVANMKAITG